MANIPQNSQICLLQITQYFKIKNGKSLFLAFATLCNKVCHPKRYLRLDTTHTKFIGNKGVSLNPIAELVGLTAD